MSYDKTIEKIEREIDNYRNNYQRVSCSISVGEIYNLYNSGDIILSEVIDKWTNEQKSILISQILIGRPVIISPVIYSDGKLEIFDGHGMIAYILSFMGVYEYPFVLEETDLLQLTGFVYNEDISLKMNNAPFFSSKMQSVFKRESIHFTIMSYKR